MLYNSEQVILYDILSVSDETKTFEIHFGGKNMKKSRASPESKENKLHLEKFIQKGGYRYEVNRRMQIYFCKHF